MARYPVGETFLNLEVIASGLREGALPPSPVDGLWAARSRDLESQEMSDLKAFGAAGWRFLPDRDLAWGPLKALNRDAPVEAGLLARHPSGGLVILRDRIVLKLASGATLGARSARYSRIRALEFGDNLFEVQLRLPDGDLEGAIRRELDDLLSGSPENADVLYAEPSLLYHLERPVQPFPDGRPPLFSLASLLPGPFSVDGLQWHWNKIRLEKAWEIGKTFGDGTRVGIIDKGFHSRIDQIHPNVAWSAYVNQDGELIPAEPIPGHEHGTVCAGLVGAIRDGLGTNGAAPECELILVAVPPHGVASQVAVARAIHLCVEGLDGQAGADVISCSLGRSEMSWELSKHLREAIDSAHGKGRDELGIPIVWAVFNDDQEIQPGSLEAYDPLICVAQSNRQDERVNSAYGPGLDLIAPGQGVAVIVRNGTGWTVERRSGSSLAAPCAAGVAALVLSVHDTLRYDQVAEILTRSCDRNGFNDWRPETGWGRLNARKAVKLALDVREGRVVL